MQVEEKNFPTAPLGSDPGHALPKTKSASAVQALLPVQYSAGTYSTRIIQRHVRSCTTATWSWGVSTVQVHENLPLYNII